MASFSPPPLIPIHGPDSTHRTVINQSMGNSEIESQSSMYAKRRNHNVKEKRTVKNTYNQWYNKNSSSHNGKLITQPDVKVVVPECQTLTKSCLEGTDVADSKFPERLLYRHSIQSQDNDPQEKGTLNPTLVTNIDCYWYRKNIENIEKINCLQNEIQILQRSLMAAESFRAHATQSELAESKKQDLSLQNIFICEHCRRSITYGENLRIPNQVRSQNSSKP